MFSRSPTRSAQPHGTVGEQRQVVFGELADAAVVDQLGALGGELGGDGVGEAARGNQGGAQRRRDDRDVPQWRPHVDRVTELEPEGCAR